MEKELPQLFVMNGGDGPNSYARNSSYQKEGQEKTRDIIVETIGLKLDIKRFSSSNPFVVADFGCSTGPNTFLAVKNIIEAVEKKYTIDSSHVPEFQVCFNNHVSNDFNTLFKSLPSNRNYFAVGVPGSFHGRLFPRASIHFANSSYTLHRLSKVPSELLDKSSLAWNKGRIFYANAAEDVVQSYSAQFARDTQSFLHARAEELLPGGLMALLIPAIPDDIPRSQSHFAAYCDVMGSVLMDMTKTGIVTEDEVDAFNIPMYQPRQGELKTLIERNGSFTIEKMEPVIRLTAKPEITAVMFRSTFASIFEKHFTNKVFEETSERFCAKVAESLTLLSHFEKYPSELSVLLKRKYVN